VNGVLRRKLDPGQIMLLRECFSVFDRQGTWPVWAYLDHVLDAKRLVAVDVLASLPAAGGQGTIRYGLTRNDDNHWLPNDDTPLALTVAGMWQLGTDTSPLLAAFMDTLRFMVDRQRNITPSPDRPVLATVTSRDLSARLAGLYRPPEAYTQKVAELAEHEPYLWRRIAMPDLSSDPWEMKVPVSIRDFRDVATVEEYIDIVEHLAAPPEMPPQPMTAAPLDIPFAVSFVDAVWESRTGSPLFARPDPASIARLTQPCDDEGAFNSKMSALADVLGQVANPGTAKAPQRRALEEIRTHLNHRLDPAAAGRCSAAIETLIKLRTIRHSIEHGDARAKAIKA
jgi:hypothetical protein